MTTAVAGSAPPTTKPAKPPRGRRKGIKSPYPSWFYIPAAVLFIVFFAVPTFASFYFSLTRWTLFNVQFIGFDNFVQFFQEPQLVQGFVNTFIYGFVTSAAKVIIGLALALLLTGPILGRGYLRAVVFFPVLVSTIGVGLTFKALLDPFHGAVNAVLGFLNLPEPGWYTDPNLALLTVAGVDVWKGVGIATLIFMAGIVAIPQEYFEAARMDGAGAWSIFRTITLPLVRPATATVIILSLIGGLREFAMIWAMTKGGPGFSSDVIASVIYKQYQAGFFGLSTAGNVILFIVVTAVMVPVSYFLNRRETEL
ncbi:carbohydrate ABC transporter permease [Microbacterium rhizomatis]|uniref:Sugar ABC transporter permease n=1 Tax=Microbacterium rhizomatis TaxID=1631477 RepID=A0A5J5J2A8_9MICO|nr:sugar ABC transporter permease [Microbacterium rhizomatis]KAA9108164.1 sugar ABC transporter permease [Microbacterium rhizomatis]